MTKNDKVGRPPTANRQRKFRDAVARGNLDGRGKAARAMRKFKAEMRAELNFPGWSKTEDLNLQLAASFYGRLIRAEEYLRSHPDPSKTAAVSAEHSTAAAGLTAALDRIKEARDKAVAVKAKDLLEAIQERPQEAPPVSDEPPAPETAHIRLERQLEALRTEPKRRRRQKQEQTDRPYRRRATPGQPGAQGRTSTRQRRDLARCAMKSGSCSPKSSWLRNAIPGQTLCDVHATEPEIRRRHWSYPDLVVLSLKRPPVPLSEAYGQMGLRCCLGCSRPLNRVSGEDCHVGCQPDSFGEGTPPKMFLHFGSYLHELWLFRRRLLQTA